MIAQYRKADPGIDMLVLNAYTDSMGARWPNQKLSEKRAAAIRQYFADMGIAPTRIEVQGHGEKQHIASNDTEAGRAANRRVVISMSRALPNYDRRGLEVGEPIFTGEAPAAASAAVADAPAAPTANPAIVNAPAAKAGTAVTTSKAAATTPTGQPAAGGKAASSTPATTTPAITSPKPRAAPAKG